MIDKIILAFVNGDKQPKFLNYTNYLAMPEKVIFVSSYCSSGTQGIQLDEKILAFVNGVKICILQGSNHQLKGNKWVRLILQLLWGYSRNRNKSDGDQKICISWSLKCQTATCLCFWKGRLYNSMHCENSVR